MRSLQGKGGDCVKNQKTLIAFCAALVLIVGGIFCYNKFFRQVDDTIDTPIVIDNPAANGSDTGTSETPPPLALSREDALQLAKEQIDIEKYNISVSENIPEIDGHKYYLIDVINKSGPSFATQLAINLYTGEMFSYDPKTGALGSMMDFPLETPISQTQDWNGVFVREGEGPSVQIDLMQADQHSFEFTVTLTESGENLLTAIASIEGAKANYQDTEQDYQILFVKNGNHLTVKESGSIAQLRSSNPIDGEYVLQK